MKLYIGDNMEEVWKDIEEFKGNYQVSILGNVRSVERFINTRTYPSKLMKKYPHKVGENIMGERVHLRMPNSKYQIQRSVAKLVLLTFVGNPPKEAKQVIHIDGNPLNNSLDNLKWDVDKSFYLPRNDKARQIFEKYFYQDCRMIVCKYRYKNLNIGYFDIEDIIQIVAQKTFNIIDAFEITEDESEDDIKRHFYCLVRQKFQWVKNKLLNKEFNKNKPKIYTFTEYNSFVGEDFDIESSIGFEDNYNLDELNLTDFANKYKLDLKTVKKAYNKVF